MQRVVDVEGLVVRFRRFQLGPIDLQLPRQASLGLAGANGAGKSTLLNVLAGLRKPDAGTVRVFDESVTSLPAAARARLGLVREDPALAEHVRVGRLMRMTAAFYPGWDWRVAEDLARRFAIDADRTVGQLSRGTRLKLQLVMALCRGADLLCLDEPFSGLDVTARQEFHDMLRGVRSERGLSMVLASHDPEELARLCDRVVVLADGRAVLAGSPGGLTASWQKWQFTATGSPPPPCGLHERRLEPFRYSWVMPAGRVDVAAHLSAHGARDVTRCDPALADVLAAVSMKKGEDPSWAHR